LTALPESLSKLQNLTSLSVSYNELTALPEWLSQLQNLTSLSVSHNKLTALPEWLSKLQNLTSLSVSYNKLTALPESLSQLQNLTWLSVSRNRLTILNILELKRLRWLDTSDNPLETPPLEVADKGIEAIHDYFRQLETKGEDYLYEAKLLIVGEGGAGKTTLARKIENPNYKLQNNEESTRGIEINQWQFPLKQGRTFRMNIWDFGGQAIYHATHQFFLTKRSLYVLVADMRKEDTDFYYWLNVVELLSDNSPVLIIKNEQQDRHREINEHQLRGQFTNLREILTTNLADNRGLNEVIEKIKYYISNLSHIGSRLPKTWVNVREALERDSRDHISFEEYLSICENNGFTEKNYKLQLSGYLHDLGVCLHFQEDPILKNIVILKPEWGTDAAYRVLDDKSVISYLGHFNKADLAAIWSESKYANKHDELLQLMMKFKLCYKIPRTNNAFIAPQLLSENQPAYPWNEQNNIILRYTYEFMPKGILTQFIVATHHLIADQACVWKSGVVLEKDKTKAEIIEHYGKREIRIRVAGLHRKELMAIVMYEFDNIHNSYKQLKCDKLIPCNCAECKNNQNPYFYPFEDLQNFLETRKQNIQCRKSAEMVNVLELIDDVIDIMQFPEKEEEPTGGIIIGNVEKMILQQSKSGDNIMATSIEKKPAVKSPWANGSFYLFVFVVVISALGVLSNSVPLYALPLILIAGILFVPIIGALQLKQDEHLSDKSFVELMKITISQLPLIGKMARKKP
ncbi:MAG: leucine-rich repeat domain-containing protein, partial [Ignavibacteriales bacterium]|nr:leucine-rich repeat domain-containing protein [Ignavibacteriales bacterium]